MERLTIEVDGTRAWFEPKSTVPSKLDAFLYSQHLKVDIEDFSRMTPFYEEGEMYPGIVDAVRRNAESQGYSVDVIDRRKAPKGGHDSAWAFIGKYRPLQKEAVDAMVAAGGGALQSPPRSGKTVIMASMVCSIGKPALIVAYNQEPLAQICDSLARFTDIPTVGRVAEGECVLGDVVVGTIQSLYKYIKSDPLAEGALGKWLMDCRVLIVDECHHAGAVGTHELFQYMRYVEHAYGVSATYRRDDDNQDVLYALFGPTPVHSISQGEHIDHGNLCPVVIAAQPVPAKHYYYTSAKPTESNMEFEVRRDRTTQLMKRKQYMKVYEDYIINGATGRNEQIAEYVAAYRKRGLTGVVIVSRVEHADVLHAMIPDAHVLVSSGPRKTTKSARTLLLDKLRHREIDCVISTVFDEAIDVPSLDTVIIAAGGKSTVKAEQRIRSTTKFAGELRTGYYRKDVGYVYLPLDQADYLTSHSRQTIKFFKQNIVNQHRENELIELETWRPGSLL